ncbi:hypothetical protein RvY_16793 [Ramazzottius varieornatus]|uniref:Mitogen-activated protein kinase n=1 Tax=Ramazzottius varieornatus TaxID=947166 RepID=A0A1D1W730_RAMVA|nr:hypothetical protein RvY_16793 [Ramazzottius varieornatus]
MRTKMAESHFRVDAQPNQQQKQLNGYSEVGSGNADGNSDELERHILKRFEIQDRLGKGAYGIVWKALDRKEQRVVALKKIFDAFANGQDAQRTFREVCFLTSFSVHPNIVKLTDIIRAENLNDLYLVFEYLPTDLHALIKAKNGLQDVHIRYIMAQLFRTVYFIHSANVIHRDLKPANILLTHPCEIRVADFGLARSLSDPGDDFQNGNLTNYVATRWYRSPEILLGSKRYTKGVDIWSLGTILAEMLRGRPLFTGENTIEQINFIRGAMSEPTTDDLHYCDTSLVRSVFNYPPHRDFRRPLESYMRSSGAAPEAVDLIRRLLHWDPDKRIDLMKAMRHPYVNAYYDPHNVYISDIAVTPFISDDKHFEDPSVYREALYEILHVQELNKSTTELNSAKTSTSKKPPNSAKHEKLEDDHIDGDVTLRGPVNSPTDSISSVEYEPLHTPVPETRVPNGTKKSQQPTPSFTKKLTATSTSNQSSPSKPLPFAQPCDANGHPVKGAVNARGFERPTENLPPGRRPLERVNSRQRVITTYEQPAPLYKTTNTASSNSLSKQAEAAAASSSSLTRAVSNGNLQNGSTGGRKAVKFEDEVPPPPPSTVQPAKKGAGSKEKTGNGEGDGGGVHTSGVVNFAKRFSFDGRAIRDRLPGNVKRSNSLARSPTPEPGRKFPSMSETRNDKKTLKESWRDTLAKSAMPEFFKRTGSQRAKAIHHAASVTYSSSTTTTDLSKNRPAYSLNFQNSLDDGTKSSTVNTRPAGNSSIVLHNGKSYGR